MSKLSKNIVYNLGGQGLVLVVALGAIKFVYKDLGGDALGIIYFALALDALLCGALELGICPTTTREVAAHFDRDSDYIRRFLRTASFIYWVAAALVALGVYWVAPVIVEKWITLKTLDPGTAVQVLRILGIAGLLNLPRSLYSSAIQGLQRMEFNNLIDVTNNAMKHLGTILILRYSGGLMDVVYWHVACVVLGAAAYFWICARFLSLSALLPVFSQGVAKRNFYFASRMTYTSILDMIHDDTVRAIVSKLLPLRVFGYYELAYSAASRGGVFSEAVSQAGYPSLSSLTGVENRGRLLAQYRKLQDLICYATAPIFAGIPFFAVPLFSFVLKTDVARMLLWPITFLAAGFYMHSMQTIPNRFSLAVGKPGILVRLSSYSLFIVLPVTLLLVYFFGLEGAGLSCILYESFSCAYFVPRFCRECLESPVSQWFAHATRIMVLALAVYGVAWGILLFLDLHSIVFLGLGYLAASAVFLTAAYFMMGEELREHTLRIVHAVRVKLAEST